MEAAASQQGEGCPEKFLAPCPWQTGLLWVACNAVHILHVGVVPVRTQACVAT